MLLPILQYWEISLVVPGEGSASQCRGHGFYPWSRDDPLCCRATKPGCHNYWSPCCIARKATAMRNLHSAIREQPPRTHLDSKAHGKGNHYNRTPCSCFIPGDHPDEIGSASKAEDIPNSIFYFNFEDYPLLENFLRNCTIPQASISAHPTFAQALPLEERCEKFFQKRWSSGSLHRG